MIPRLGEPVVSGVEYKERAGAYALLPRNNLVLVTHQSDPDPEFQLPGGAVDCGESLLAALHREVLEETGWKIRVDRMLCSFIRFTFMPEYDLWARKVCHVFLAFPVPANWDSQGQISQCPLGTGGASGRAFRQPR